MDSLNSMKSTANTNNESPIPYNEQIKESIGIKHWHQNYPKNVEELK